jgi:predicted amidohydrolase
VFAGWKRSAEYGRVRCVFSTEAYRLLFRVITKQVVFSCCGLILVGAVSSSRAADTAPAAGLANTNGKEPHALRVAGAQLPVTKDVQKNLEAITRAIEFAAREKADILVTPEGSLSGYTARFDAAATARAIEVIVQRARRANLALVLGTCFSDTDGTRYDAQRFYDREGDYLGFHAKILLCRWMPDPKRKGEVDSFKSAPLRTFQLDGLTVGGLVCNDMWANPESTPMPDPHLAQQLAEQGARVVFLSVNSGQDEGEALALHRAYHESNLQIRSRSARLWVVVANACDLQGRREANCHSGVMGPDGRWVVQSDPKGEQYFAHTILIE